MSTHDLLSRTVKISDGTDAFDVSVVEAARPQRFGLFAVGAGGNPSRHLSLLQSLASLGCTMVAPHFDMLASPIPTKGELEKRIRRLEASTKEFVRGALPLVGVGHSIGTVILLALAGAEARTLAGDQVTAESRWKFSQLALLAPPTDFFRQPDALKAVDVAIRIWVGAQDSITPPCQAQFLKAALESRIPIEVQLDEQAGHFTFMDTLPPNRADPHPNRSAFLATLAHEVGQFVLG